MGLTSKQYEILNKFSDYITDTWTGRIKSEEDIVRFVEDIHKLKN